MALREPRKSRGSGGGSARIESLRSLLQRVEPKGRSPGDPAMRLWIRSQLGRTFEKMGQWSSAVREYRRGILESRREARKRNPRGAKMLGTMRLRIADLARRRGHSRLAIAFLAAARGGLRRALRRFPDGDGLVQRLAEAARGLAEIQADREESDVALKTLGALVADLETYALRNPASLDGQRELAKSCCTLADACDEESEPDRATLLRGKAEAIYRTLLHLAPDDRIRMELSDVVHDLALVALIDRKLLRAEAMYEESLGLLLATEDLEVALEDDPLRIVHACWWVGRAREERGDFDGVRAAHLKTFAALEIVARRGVRDRKERRMWGRSFADEGVELCRDLLALVEDGLPWEAPALLRRGRAFLKTLVDRGLIGAADQRRYSRRLAARASEL
jgi:tetratricopeptide (TPR) repeat protein